MNAKNDLESLLIDRAVTHGDFTEHAAITQSLKRIMQRSQGWKHLDDRQHEGLEMIAHKVGRILAGNPNHKDHWDDISGYAKIVADRLE